MTGLSPYQVLLSAYPGSIRSRGSERVMVKTIRDYTNPDDLGAMRERLATVLADLDSEWVTYSTEADDRQRRAHEQEHGEATADTDRADTTDGMPEEFERFGSQEADDQSVDSSATESAVEFDYDPSDIELAELTGDSKVISVPYPRAYRCPNQSCGHFTIKSPEDVGSQGFCPHDTSHGEIRRFPYLFVCPRCAHVEQASPHRELQDSIEGPAPQVIIDDDDSPDQLTCPDESCNGHLDVNLGDRLSGVQFFCTRCSASFRFEGDCPDCHKPSVNDEDEIVSEMRPKTIDANKTQPLLLEDIASQHGTRLAALRKTSQEDQADNDIFHWDLDSVAMESAATIRDTFGLSDVFTVSSVDSVSAVYGYESTVTSRGTDLDEQGRFARTFSAGSSGYERRAYLTRRGGRGIVFQLQKEVVASVIREGDASYDAIAEEELRLLNEEMDVDDMANDTQLQLVPLLHAYQHAIYQAAIEEAGLEDFLASKLLVESGAIVLVEKRKVGAGGLSQVTTNDTGSILLRTLQRAEEILNDCSRDCENSCLSCVFTEDARCHPFISREVSGYVPANSLLDRHLASEVIRHA